MVLAALAGSEVWPQGIEWPDSTARDTRCETQQCRLCCLGVVLAALVRLYAASRAVLGYEAPETVTVGDGG